MRIVLGVSGGIAAYKTPELVRRLQDAGAEVRVIVTQHGAHFVSPLALAAVSNHGVVLDQWSDTGHGGVDHIELARWAELLLIAPATANIIAKLAHGIADDQLTTYALAHRGPVVVAPAMNTQMLLHPTVGENLKTLQSRGVDVIEPDAGLLACGDEGAGRLPDPPVLIARVRSHFRPRDLEGRAVLVTAGPTREAIDPVRYISNRSSGKMGYALAAAAFRRGATVTLVSGPTLLTVPPGVKLQQVTTAAEMRDAVMAAAPSQQIVIKAAAVADFAPAEVAKKKIKKSADGNGLTLELKRNPDILAELAATSPRPFIVAFAAETDQVAENAREKLRRKGADLIVANDVSQRSIGFDADQNEVLILGKDGFETTIARAPKLTIADRILDLVVARLE
ncbi:MAG TPA: bifunctional phosphopantothenoylcysteine decarboxylase/phosphopantothenate--cysteine ligase CoaBC [Thermoanaerobaculia bacterium]|jgi:phosphopantothenoylcysteine decarboxylase/phosphopantothenate--cysteine ligase|nr:bifunctional phosphopantothenoylcysteine decarboxylase/phosphopantothenate--cysteine ligase CoaBC [Thermoanaerobaculia bacterium]